MYQPKEITGLHESSSLGRSGFVVFNLKGGGRVSIPADQIARMFNEEEQRRAIATPELQSDEEKAIIEKAKGDERQRCVDLSIEQYSYWRELDSDDPTLNNIAMGAMGAASNILAAVLGLNIAMPKRIKTQ